eukprot:scaffold38047_cov32-Tisochrysis_lutea.AAC.1
MPCALATAVSLLSPTPLPSRPRGAEGRRRRAPLWLSSRRDWRPPRSLPRFLAEGRTEEKVKKRNEVVIISKKKEEEEVTTHPLPEKNERGGGAR